MEPYIDMTDYSTGFQAQLEGATYDSEKSLAWRRGWAAADLAEDSGDVSQEQSTGWSRPIRKLFEEYSGRDPSATTP